MTKHFVLLFLVFLLIPLQGCVRQLDVDVEVIDQAIGALEVDITHLMVTRDGQVATYEIERVEILDASDLEALLIHIIVSSMIAGMSEDYLLLITPDWIYSTKDMSKTVNEIDATDPQGFRTLVYRYTDLIDYDLLTNAALETLAQSLGEVELSVVRGVYTLVGTTPLIAPLPDGVLEVAKFIYVEDRLEELHLNRQYDFESTRQQSNYISGTHYYFSDQLPIEFPPLSGFDLVE